MLEQFLHIIPYGIIIAATGMLMAGSPTSTAFYLIIQTILLLTYCCQISSLSSFTEIILTILLTTQTLIFVLNFYITRSFSQHRNKTPNIIILLNLFIIIYFLFNFEKIQNKFIKFNSYLPQKLELDTISLIVIIFTLLTLAISNIFILNNKDLD